MKIGFFGSSLVSAYWNGAATYYRGIIRALHKRGYDITFYEPDLFDRQKHRDIEDPPWCRVVVYAGDEHGVREAMTAARDSDVIVKCSGVGLIDRLLENVIMAHKARGARVVFWDVDAPATLDRLMHDNSDPFLPMLPEFDLVFTYGGGNAVQDAYAALGAQGCVPIYNAMDPDVHHPAPRDARFEGLLGLMANRLPDREQRVHDFFVHAAREIPDQAFILGGSGWEPQYLPANIQHVGHVYTRDHNAFNCTPLAVLNINRESMARYGLSPATRVFEAAAAGACIITDAWTGVEAFLEPGAEWLVVRDGRELTETLQSLNADRARAIGAAARARVLRDHTYDQRVADVDKTLSEVMACA